MLQTICTSAVVYMALFWTLEHSIFEFVQPVPLNETGDFDIRISNLKMVIQEIIPDRVIPKHSPSPAQRAGIFEGPVEDPVLCEDTRVRS